MAHATRLPLSVAEPMKADSAIEIWSCISGTPAIAPGISAAADATNADAPPPNPLKAATSWGIAVIRTLTAQITPIAAPMASPIAIKSKLTICLSTSVATIASSMPVAPSKLPRTAVRGEVRPLRPRMKRTAATR